jgi:hypothetical protein
MCSGFGLNTSPTILMVAGCSCSTYKNGKQDSMKLIIGPATTWRFESHEGLTLNFRGT